MILSVTLNPCVDVILFTQGMNLHDTNRVARQEIDAGGKGVNLSRVAVELGAASVATGFLGGSPGGQVRHVLKEQGVERDFVAIRGSTRMNLNVEDGSGAPPTTFNAKGPEISASEWQALLEKVERHAGLAAWVAMGGSLPPGVPPDAYRILAEIVHRSSARLLLDADGEAMRLGLAGAPDMVKPNRDEAGRLVGRELTTFEDCQAACMEIRRMLESAGSDDPIAVLSMGSAGALAATSEGLWFARPIPIEPCSTIGSGDSMLGGLLAGLCRGLTFAGAFALGSAAGAATATTDGSSIARRLKVEELLASASVEKLL